MASTIRCCVSSCSVTRKDANVTLHRFPNPEKETHRFHCWLTAIGGNLWAMNHENIYKTARVCHKHFEEKYKTWTHTLTKNAIPSLYLKEARTPLLEVTKIVDQQDNVKKGLSEKSLMFPSTSTKALQETMSSDMIPEHHMPMFEQQKQTSKVAKQSAVPKLKKASHTSTSSSLLRLVKKLKKKTDTYAARLKKASKLLESEGFKKYVSKFSTMAALLTVMQFREIAKPKMGRKFTLEEKLMALSLYKQGPRAYRWLSRIFVLPSPITLSRIISKANISPGINKNIFAQLKKKASTLSQDEKLCVLLFDEIALNPHFEYNRRKDCIGGFTNNGFRTKREIADHALVFMIRGIIKNYKQPIAYTFCRGTTPAYDLQILIKNIITQLQESGFKVIATICDQGSTNVSAINTLIEETRQSLSKKNKANECNYFKINGEEIIPLFDVPHLLKGIRNNLITKNLTYIVNGIQKTAKWEHIVELYEENPTYKGIRLIKNFTEAHVIPNKIPKMKVKFATQVFSRTVAVNMGYLADKGVLKEECKDTADILLFFDNLFDSLNGSYESFKKKAGKSLLGPVTPSSEHIKVWQNAATILKTMKFITKAGKVGSVPSLSNWIRTLINMEHLVKKIFYEYKFKSLWIRHLNQDPLENFFGCIRSHGCRNVSPSPNSFEAAFISLLVTNMTRRSKGSNCEEDCCKQFDTMKLLFEDFSPSEIIQDPELGLDDIVDLYIVDFELKKKNINIFAQLSYVTGYILRQTKKHIFKNCLACKNNLCSKTGHEYITRKEIYKNKVCLTYPAESLIKFFSEMQDIITHVLENKSNVINLKGYCKKLIFSLADFDLLEVCEVHKQESTDFIVDLTCRFFINNWCRDTNRLLNGTRKDINIKDNVQKMALLYSKRNIRAY